MVRPNKRKRQSRDANMASVEKRKTLILRGMRAALAAVCVGLPYTSIALVSYLLGIPSTSRYFFNIGINAITSAIIDEAKSCWCNSSL